MAYDNSSAAVKKPHFLSLENRESLILRGVERVDSFNEEEISLLTSGGELFIGGTQLHIEALDLERGESRVTGHINELRYCEIVAEGGFLRRLFG